MLILLFFFFFFFFSSRRRHTRWHCDWSSDVCSSDLRPVAKEVGDRVVAGTVSTDSAIRVRVDALGDDTTLAGIQRLVAQAQASRSRAQVLADRAEIGRASCRERVEISGVAGSGEREV